MTNNMATVLPAWATRQVHQIESKSTVADSAGTRLLLPASLPGWG